MDHNPPRLINPHARHTEYNCAAWAEYFQSLVAGLIVQLPTHYKVAMEDTGMLDRHTIRVDKLEPAGEPDINDEGSQADSKDGDDQRPGHGYVVSLEEVVHDDEDFAATARGPSSSP